MAVDFGRTFERSPEGYNTLSHLLYAGSLLIAASTLADVSGTILLIGCIAVIVLAGSRKSDSAGTIFASHFSNIQTTMTFNLIAAIILLAITVLTLGIGIIITWPLSIILLAWTAWRMIRGLMKLNDGQGY